MPGNLCTAPGIISSPLSLADRRSLLVASLILGSAVGFFSSGELFYDICELEVSIFQCDLPMFCPVLSSEGALIFCWTQVTGGHPVLSVILHVVDLHNISFI